MSAVPADAAGEVLTPAKAGEGPHQGGPVPTPPAAAGSTRGAGAPHSPALPAPVPPPPSSAETAAAAAAGAPVGAASPAHPRAASPASGLPPAAPAAPAQPRAGGRTSATGGGPSRYRGVVWHKSNSKWEARIYEGGRQLFLGYFTEEDAAARAYDARAGDWAGLQRRASARGGGGGGGAQTQRELGGLLWDGRVTSPLSMGAAGEHPAGTASRTIV